MTETVLLPLLGGALIGVAAGALMVLSGRIAGISGIFGGVVERIVRPDAWRVSFVLGLVVGGVGLTFFYPQAFPTYSLDARSISVLVGAGLLVGFGTRLGGGCTSGHGVCGVARLSSRSIVATLTFIATGAATVALSRAVGLY